MDSTEAKKLLGLKKNHRGWEFGSPAEASQFGLVEPAQALRSAKSQKARDPRSLAGVRRKAIVEDQGGGVLCGPAGGGRPNPRRTLFIIRSFIDCGHSRKGAATPRRGKKSAKGRLKSFSAREGPWANVPRRRGWVLRSRSIMKSCTTKKRGPVLAKAKWAWGPGEPGPQSSPMDWTKEKKPRLRKATWLRRTSGPPFLEKRAMIGGEKKF